MRRRLMENFGWKLLSLAIAVILWIAVAGEPRTLLRAVPSQIRDLFDRGAASWSPPLRP